MKKEILFLCQFFYPEHVSSATLPYDTAKYLVDQGHSVDVVCGYPKEYSSQTDIPTKENVNGIGVKRIRYLHAKRTSTLGRIINYISFLLAVLLHLPTLANHEIVVVYSNPPLLPVLAVLAKKLYYSKVIYVSYDVYPEISQVTRNATNENFMEKCSRLANKVVFRNVDKVIVLCEDMKEYLVQNRDISSDNVVCIHNWYEDVPQEDRRVDRDTGLFSNWDKDSFVVSYLGNMGTCQDETTLSTAIMNTPPDEGIKYLFAGHGNKMDKIKQKFLQANYPHVAVHDFLQGNDYIAALARSNCFIVSLVDGLYGLCSPSKVCGYLMQGRPIICIMDKRTELAMDIISFNAGIVLSVGDSACVLDYINLLQSNPQLYEGVSCNARRLFLAKYEKYGCLQAYERLITQLLGGEHGSS